jgi:hypothetical protein
MTTNGETVPFGDGDNDLPLARVTQQFTAKQDGGGNVGDCVRACICSMTGLAVEDVPHFAKHGFDDPKGTPDHNVWWHALVGFMALLEPSYVTVTTETPPEPSDTVDDLYGMYLASGKSPRGDWQHCVVGRGGEVIWDPHPSRAGVDGPLTCDAYFVLASVYNGGRDA